MKNTILTLVMLLFTAAAFGEDVRSVIESRNKEWTDAFNRGDIKAISVIYDRGSLVIPGGREVVLSRPEFEQLLEGYTRVIKDMRFETISLDVMGDYAYELGRSHFVAVAEDGTETPAFDRYLVIWRKGEDGVWYYHLDAWWTPGQN